MRRGPTFGPTGADNDGTKKKYEDMQAVMVSDEIMELARGNVARDLLMVEMVNGEHPDLTPSQLFANVDRIKLQARTLVRAELEGLERIAE
jgi:hypothetical protein